MGNETSRRIKRAGGHIYMDLPNQDSTPMTESLKLFFVTEMGAKEERFKNITEVYNKSVPLQVYLMQQEELLKDKRFEFPKEDNLLEKDGLLSIISEEQALAILKILDLPLPGTPPDSSI